MRTRTLAVFTALACVCFAATAGAQDFDLTIGLESAAVADLDATSTITGDPMAEVEFTGNMTLTTSGLTGEQGPQGWSLSVSNDGVDILDVTTAGTVSAPIADGGLQDTGFDVTEVVDPADNGGKQGMVSAVVLSFVKAVYLPPNTANVVCIATYRATLPDASATATIAFENGLKGQGQPVENNVTQEGQTEVPSLGSREIQLEPNVPDVEICDDGIDNDDDGDTDCADSDCVGEAVCLEQGNCADGVDNDLDGDTDCDDSDCADFPGCEAGGFDLVLGNEAAVDQVLEVNPAAGTAFVVTASITPNDPEDPDDVGAQGWSLGMEHDPAVLDALDVTTAGTLSAPVGDDPPGLQDTGFEKSEIVDPAQNGGRAGLVSAVVLSFVKDVTLDPTQPQSVLKATYAVSDAAGDTDFDTMVEFADGLKGAGQPVDTVLTVLGSTVNAKRKIGLQVLAGDGPPAEDEFVRGDANDDGKVNIADPIWIINELIRSGPPTLCQDSADANNDGMIDLSDAMYLIEYRFLAGALPPAPFPECGADAEGPEDGLACPGGSTESCP